MVVSRMSNSASFQSTLETQLREVGLEPEDMYFTQAIKCRNFEQNSSNTDVKTCKTYLDLEIETIKPKYILALGNEALLATTGHSGIMKYRGRVIDREGHLVIPTISPSAVNRNPGQRPGYMADLRLFSNTVRGIDMRGATIKPLIVDDMDKLKKLKRILEKSVLISYDVETHSEEWRSDGRIVSVSGTCEVELKGKIHIFGFALPLYHPESPWKKTWRAVLRFLAPAWTKIKKIIAQNGKYDDKWMNTFGCPLITTFDTMLAIHLLNENVQKGLKPQAQARLGVAPWGIDTKQLLTTPIAEVLEYNFLDTYYTYKIYLQLREELIAQPRLLRLFKLLMMPAHKELVYSEMRGIWIDVERLKERKPIAQAKLKEIENGISQFLPKPEDEAWPKDRRGRPSPVNYNASNFARWFLFEHLQLPVLARGKEKADGSPGSPSMAEGVLLELETEHPAVRFMLDRVQWQKALSSFFNAYEEIYDEDHRIHTNFKLAGTVTGRLSSGKADEDKISGTRGKVRGINLQQVPRDPFIRGLFGAPPGWSFVEADYSQIELRIAAFLARERHMLQLYSQGADIHLTTAARIAGIPESRVTKKVRKELGKPVNFGFLYGMSWAKFIITAFVNYGVRYDEYGARAARAKYFELYPDLLAWHARQRRLVEAHGRVQSPIGRIRHLPDIYSPDQGVRAEAERQAINSPVQGFASDLAVLSMVHITAKLRDLGMAANCLGLVHDAINFEIRNDHLAQVLPIIKDTMEDMSIVRKKFGVHIDIPIIADIKVGQHWGDAEEIPVDAVYDWDSYSARH
jgi:DNA polymerase-1